MALMQGVLLNECVTIVISNMDIMKGICKEGKRDIYRAKETSSVTDVM